MIFRLTNRQTERRTDSKEKKVCQIKQYYLFFYENDIPGKKRKYPK